MPLQPNQYQCASNLQLFTELERLTLLCGNLTNTIEQLERQNNCDLGLVQQLTLYAASQESLKSRLTAFIISQRRS